MIQADLGPELEDYLQRLVAKGAFPSEGAALQTSVRLLREREDALQEFNSVIEEGLADIAAGRIHEIDEVRRILRDRTVADISAKA